MSASGRLSPKHRDLKEFTEGRLSRHRALCREMQKADRDVIIAARRALAAMTLSLASSNTPPLLRQLSTTQ
jgi:hypothetical protein